MNTQEKDSLKMLYYFIPALLGGSLLIGGIGILTNGGKTDEGIFMVVTGLLFLAVSLRQFFRKRPDRYTTDEDNP